MPIKRKCLVSSKLFFWFHSQRQAMLDYSGAHKDFQIRRYNMNLMIKFNGTSTVFAWLPLKNHALFFVFQFVILSNDFVLQQGPQTKQSNWNPNKSLAERESERDRRSVSEWRRIFFITLQIRISGLCCFLSLSLSVCVRLGMAFRLSFQLSRAGVDHFGKKGIPSVAIGFPLPMLRPSWGNPNPGACKGPWRKGGTPSYYMTCMFCNWSCLANRGFCNNCRVFCYGTIPDTCNWTLFIPPCYRLWAANILRFGRPCRACC